MRNVLVVAPFFTPSGKTGAKRPTFLTHLWHGSSLNVHVLALNEKYYASRDSSLRGGGHVHRAGMMPPVATQRNRRWKRAYQRLLVDHLSLIDEYAGWIGPALLKGLRIVREHRIDVVLATGPPFSAMVMAALLSRMTSAKLVLDYRDPWTGHPWDQSDALPGRVALQSSTFLKRRVNDAAEHYAVKQASAVVCCTQIMTENFARQLGAKTSASCHVVTSGFDPGPVVEPLRLESDRKVILYAGEFYGERRMALIVEPLLELIAAGEIAPNEVAFHVFGRILPEDQDMIARHGLGRMIQEHAPIDHGTILGYMAGADILFLPSGSDVDYALPFKLYDYLRVKRPILAVAPPRSAVAQLMAEVDCGELAVIHDSASVQKALRTMLRRAESYTFTGSERYHWQHLAKAYADIIEDVARSD